jgi:DNA polymerase III epsilon subunit-like protein
MRILVFDTETTGLPNTKIINPDTLDLWPHIVQLSYVIYDISLNEIAEQKDFIIRVPENVEIPEEAYKLHGITKEISYEKGVDIKDTLSWFYYHLKTVDKIIGHNVNFDINMIKVETLRIIYDTLTPPQITKMFKFDLHYITNYDNIVCTLQDSIKLCNIQATTKYGKPYLKYPKLIELHQKLFESTPNNLHNSLNDILITLRCYMKLKYDVDLNKSCNPFKTAASKINLL